MIKTSVYNLAIGMHVSKLDRNWLSTSFFRHSFLIENQRQLKRLKEECEFVFIDLDKSVVDASRKQATVRQAESIKSATKEINSIKKSLVDIFRQIQQSSYIDTKLLIPTIGPLINKVFSETNTYLYVIRLKKKDDSLAEKSIRVFILFLAFAKHIGVKKSLLLDIGLAAILHDIGMLCAPKELLKSAFISKGERKFIESHTKVGVEILSKENVFSDLTLKIIKHHHENVDGSGYPNGIKGRDIDLYSRMLNITCMYEALTRDRIYRKGISPIEAVKILTLNTDSKLDKRLTLKFIEAIGIYPLGSVIALSNGATFKVLSFDKKNGYSVVSKESIKENERAPTPKTIQSSDVKQLICVNSSDS